MVSEVKTCFLNTSKDTKDHRPPFGNILLLKHVEIREIGIEPNCPKRRDYGTNASEI